MVIIDTKNTKNKIKQIIEKKIVITNEMPSRDNFSKKNPRKVWISTIFIDISGYTELCLDWPEKDIAKLISCFHEGILDIFKYYGIKNIDIQGDGIYGILDAPKKNDPNDKLIFEAALDINGFLYFFLRPIFNDEFNYKIGVGSKEELMIIVGRENEREIVYAGGSVNEAKKLLEYGEEKNCIYLSEGFVDNNLQNLISLNDEKMYEYNPKSNSYISNWCNRNWK